MNKKEWKRGLQVNWSEAPGMYDGDRNFFMQQVGRKKTNINKSYKSTKGWVTVKNQFVEVTVYEDGRIHIKEHEQVNSCAN